MIVSSAVEIVSFACSVMDLVFKDRILQAYKFYVYFANLPVKQAVCLESTALGCYLDVVTTVDTVIISFSDLFHFFLFTGWIN